MQTRIFFKAILALIVLNIPALGQDNKATVTTAKLGNTRNVHTCGSMYLAGQPTEDDIQVIKSKGIKRVVTLRQDSEVQWDEGAAVRAAGLEFIPIPIGSPEALTDEVIGRLRRLMRDSERFPILLHCGSASRVGAAWLTHRVLDQDVSLDKAREEARQVGLRSPSFEAQALDYIRRQKARNTSVPAGINDNFLRADLDIREWIGRFEVESREVFAARHKVVSITGVRAGDRVADIGAGTGFFTRLFSAAAGPDGWVFAVDISTRFIEHIVEQSHRNELDNVSAVLSRQHTISLPPSSIDIAFVCDTYHHFEYPKATLKSIHRALRPGGRLVVVDFERIPGQSREFILNHVRAGKDVFRREIEAANFEFIEEIEVDELVENYVLTFRRN